MTDREDRPWETVIGGDVAAEAAGVLAEAVIIPTAAAVGTLPWENPGADGGIVLAAPIGIAVRNLCPVSTRAPLLGARKLPLPSKGNDRRWKPIAGPDFIIATLGVDRGSGAFAVPAVEVVEAEVEEEIPAEAAGIVDDIDASFVEALPDALLDVMAAERVEPICFPKSAG